MAGGEQPPKRLRESSCGDFHSLHQVLLKLPDMKDSVSFLPVPPSLVCLISENPGCFQSLVIPPGRARAIAYHLGPEICILEGAEVVVKVKIRSMTIVNN